MRRAAGRQIVSHRSEEFRLLLRGILDRLRPLLGTSGPLLPFTASGTGGLEALTQNCIPPGGRVLAVSIGHFGDRFAEAATAWGASVTEWRVPWGAAADPDTLREHVRRAAPLDAILITHNETSTGVLNPLAALVQAAREESDALVLVDGVSSVGVTELAMDAWGVDALVTVTHKGLMAPPGLAIVAVGRRAEAMAERNPRQRFYFDFARMRAAVEEGTTTYTPAISTIFALDASLTLIHREGLGAVFERHRRLARLVRARVAATGLQVPADAAHASPAVTAVVLPPGLRAGEVRKRLSREYSVVVSQGRSSWKDSVLRIGHMGWVDEADVDETLTALEEVVGEHVARKGEAAPVEAAR